MENVEGQSAEKNQELPEGSSSEGSQRAQNSPAEESFIVETHRKSLAVGFDRESMMSEPALAAGEGDFHAAQIVSGSDTTEAGKALVADLMQYEHYRRSFTESVPSIYDDALDRFKPDLEAGMAVANGLIKDAETRFGPLPPSDKPTKMEIKAWREQYGSRISLEEVTELTLPRGLPVVAASDAKFGDLGILSEEGFEVAFDNAVVKVHQLELANSAKASNSAPATKKPRQPRAPKQPAVAKDAAVESKKPRSKAAKPQAAKQPIEQPTSDPGATTASASVVTGAAEASVQQDEQSAPVESASLQIMSASGADSAITAEEAPVIKELPAELGRDFTPNAQFTDVPAQQARTSQVDTSNIQQAASAPATQQEAVENLVPEPQRAIEPKIAVEDVTDSLPINEPVITPRQVNAEGSEASGDPVSDVDTIWCGPRRGVDEPQPDLARIDKDKLLLRLDSKLQDDKSVLYTLDGEPAFIDRGMRLEMAEGASQSDEKVLAALLTAAQYYHGRIELTGSDAFQRKAIGLIAQYQPNVTMKKPDQQMLLIEARKALQVDPAAKDAIHGDTAPDHTAAAQPPVEPSPPQAANTPGADNASTAPPERLEPIVPAESNQPAANTASDQAKSAAQFEPVPSPGAGFTKTRPSDIHESPQSASKGVVGKVLGSGDAPFQFDENNTQSTYITLRTKTGVETYWGKELAGLLRDTRITPGKVVTLQWLGKEPVTINVPIKDDQGNVKRYEKKDTHRNQWSLAVMGGATVRTGQDEGVKMVAYDANRFAQVQQNILTRLRLDIPLPSAPADGLYWMTPDGQGSFKSGDGLTAPRPPADNAVAGHPVMSSYSKDGHLDMALFRGDGPFLQGIVRQNGEFQHVLVSLPNRDDSPPMVFNALTPTCLAPIGVGNGINASGGQPVSRENIAFKIDGDSAVRIGKLDKPAELPPSLHSRLGFDERWRDDNTLPKSAPAAAPTVQPSEPRPA